MKAVLTGLAFLVLAVAARAEQVTTFTLENGMDVVVIEDRRAPVVVHMVWYRTGSADEPPGVSGAAHFLEHLMFKGTDRLEQGEFSAIVAANGGRDNAFTSFDYTAYFQRIAADRLDLVMGMEADRMNNLALTPQNIATERQVILEERSSVVDANPDAILREQMRAVQFLNHRYGTPIIGWRHEMEALDMEPVLAFYDLYYSPNNAILVVAGDVDPEKVRDLAERHYGAIPAEPDLPPRARAAEPPQLAARRLVYEDARIAQPYVLRTYLAPQRRPGDQREAAALTYLAEILGGSTFTSVLGTRLMFDEGLALYAGAFYDGTSLDKTTFGVTVTPVNGVTLQQAEDALDRAIADFLADGVDPERMDRLRMQFRASEIYARDDAQGLARRYGAALAIGLSVQDVQDWSDILQTVTAEEVMAAAERVFDPRASVTAWAGPPPADPMPGQDPGQQEVTQ